MKIYFTLSLIIFLTSCGLIQFGGYFEPPSKLEALTNNEYNWQTDSTDHFYFIYEKHSDSQKYLDSAKIFFDNSYDSLLTFLEIPSYNKKLTLFMIDSYSKMDEVIGWKSNGIANAKDNIVYQIFNDSLQTFGIHEFCHVVSTNKWGMYKEIWVSEGLAVASDDKWWGFELHNLVNYLNMNNKYVPIKDLVNNFHNFSVLYSYPECGSFVKYIKDKYGIDFLKELWEYGHIAFEEKLNKNISEIENEWLDELKKYDYSNINYAEKIYNKLGKQL